MGAALTLAAVVAIPEAGDPLPPSAADAATDPDDCAAIARHGPPPTRRGTTVDELHGVRVPDPYRWLEDIADPSVLGWANDQDTYARAHLQALPGRAEFTEALRAKLDVPAASLPIVAGEGQLIARRTPGRDHPVWMLRDASGAERVLLDPLVLDPSGRTTLRRPVPSPSGRHLAYLRSVDGADAASLWILDVQTGEHLPEVLVGARYAAAAWNADGTAFAYTALPDDPSIPSPKLPRHAEIRRHTLGTPQADDTLLFGPLRDHATFVGVEAVDEGRTWVLTLSHDWTATDLYVRASMAAGARWRRLFVGHDALAAVSAYQGHYFVLTNADAPRFRVVEIDPAWPQPRHWRTVVPQAERDTLEGAEVFGGRLLLSWLRDASSTLEVRTLGGDAVATVDLPQPTSVVGVSGTAHGDTVWLHHSALDRPPAIDRLSMASGELDTWHTDAVSLSPAVQVEQHWVESRDGTPVSVFVLERDDRGRSPAPALLTGYGGFGVSMRPGFSAAAAVWAERGGVWALANLRGGGEFGEAWHEAGRRAHKQNTFDDFIAVAEFLERRGYTEPSRLAIRGGSNGGLLVGAAMTQRPDRFGAVICAVPLLDMIRFVHYGAGPTWVGEYGSPDDPEQFSWLWGYSPLHKVREGVHYPPLLMLSADSDDRVDPMHARKFVAAIQHTGSEALLRIERGAGHGGSPRLHDRIEAEADALGFAWTRTAAQPAAASTSR